MLQHPNNQGLTPHRSYSAHRCYQVEKKKDMRGTVHICISKLAILLLLGSYDLHLIAVFLWEKVLILGTFPLITLFLLNTQKDS